MKRTKTQSISERNQWIHEFENLYILTYKSLYRHAKLIFGQEDKTKELLIQVYMEAYQRGEQLQKEKSPLDWLLKRSDFLAETRIEATKEMIEASYAEEKMQSKEAKKENLTNLDETSLLLEIEDRLGIVEGDGEHTEEPELSREKRIISLLLLAAALVLAVAGIWKVKHQLDLLQDMFGCILEAEGYKSNRGGLYEAEDTISACFKFDSGLPGSGSWCFVAHDSAKEDRIEIIGDKGMICFSVFTYDPIALHTERGREEILPPNPPHVQLPLIKAVVEHLQGKAVCTCDGVSATPTNWVMDRILNKL